MGWDSNQFLIENEQRVRASARLRDAERPALDVYIGFTGAPILNALLSSCWEKPAILTQ